MAIITDATGRQLAQAVGGIDTGGLAKDTTLQATNTALGNMNTTQQSIASAISGLGATLGSDKANISGDNIANPSVFRQNIGCEWETITNAISDPNSNVEEVVLKKCNGLVYISLTTKQKTYKEGDILFTLTNNAVIPLNNQRLVCWCYAADKCYTITVRTNGTVDCYGKGSITGRLIFYGFYFAE